MEDKKNEKELGRMGPMIDTIQPDRLFIDDDTDTTLANLRSKARRHQMEHGLDLLVVDYLQLIDVTDRAASENQTQRITFISKSLKNLARELQCPVGWWKNGGGAVRCLTLAAHRFTGAWAALGVLLGRALSSDQTWSVLTRRNDVSIDRSHDANSYSNGLK